MILTRRSLEKTWDSHLSMPSGTRCSDEPTNFEAGLLPMIPSSTAAHGRPRNAQPVSLSVFRKSANYPAVRRYQFSKERLFLSDYCPFLAFQVTVAVATISNELGDCKFDPHVVRDGRSA